MAASNGTGKGAAERNPEPEGIWTRRFATIFLLLSYLAIPAAIVVLVIRFTTSKPPQRSEDFVGFQEGPNRRGTMEIILMCLSTLVSCVYAIVHPDVPKDEEDPKSKYEGNYIVKLFWRFLYWLLRKYDHSSFNHRLPTIVIGLLFPELLLFQAVIDFQDADILRRRINYVGKKDTPEDKGLKKWNLELAFFAGMGGFSEGDKDEVMRIARIQEFLKSPSGKHLDWSKIKRTIRRRSRKDTLVKIIAIFQLIWIYIQTFARIAENLPISPLEITTCAHIVCAIFTYAFWVRKPYDVQEPIDLTQGRFRLKNRDATTISPPTLSDDLESQRRANSALRNSSSAHVHSLGQRKEPRISMNVLSHWPSHVFSFSQPPVDSDIKETIAENDLGKFFEKLRILPMSNLTNRKDKKANLWPLIFPVVIGGIYAAIHCIVWKIAFENSDGQELWRICSSILFAMPVLFFISAIFMITGFRGSLNKPSTRRKFCFVLSMLFANAVARGTIFILSFYAFCGQPAGVYEQIDWSQFFPFLG